jgi:sec-independent protein translocase protein TatA
VKGFKEGMREGTAEGSATPPQQVTSGQTIEGEVKEKTKS